MAVGCFSKKKKQNKKKKLLAFIIFTLVSFRDWENEKQSGIMSDTTLINLCIIFKGKQLFAVITKS